MPRHTSGSGGVFDDVHEAMTSSAMSGSSDIDRETTEATLMRLYPSLRRFAAVVAPRELAPDDLVQEALVALLRGGPVSRIDNPAAYLRRSMLNLASNHRRRLGRARRMLTRLEPETAAGALDHYPSDLAHLAMLRPDARAVLYLHHVEGMPLEAIAIQLGIGSLAVRQIAVRGRRVLREHIEQQEVRP